MVESGDFAVNQNAEHIIFEVDRQAERITAHVLIQYAGSPEEFAWIVPVPSVPDFDTTPQEAFGLLQQFTAPQVSMGYESLCPDADFVCRQHSSCDDGSDGDGGWDEGGGVGGGEAEGDSDDADSGGDTDGIDIKKKEQVGDYDVVVFEAAEPEKAVAWLRDNGFVVNASMTPYMQPYIDAGMNFVAAKLVAGAGADQISPLRMTYDGTQPMIPLQLTAVAAEPHLAVVASIYGDANFEPVGHPLVRVPAERITVDETGRNNYPMVLNRAIDEAGGDAFVVEFSGPAPVPVNPNDVSGCCSAGDPCSIGNDQLCQCPGSAFDAADCADEPGLVEGWALLERLATTHARYTRLITRLSPEEMTFDPAFAAAGTGGGGQLNLRGTFYELDRCRGQLVDPVAVLDIQSKQACAGVYCGAGECTITPEGAGCVCEPEYVARRFFDMDGLPSVTCVPAKGTVDLELEVDLPDPCVSVDCGAGSCVAVGGFPNCSCDPGFAAIADAAESPTPFCLAAVKGSGGPGAVNHSSELRTQLVCKPDHPECGEHGWLVPNTNLDRPGIVCEGWSTPDPALMIPPPDPCSTDTNTTTGDGSGGASASAGSSSSASSGGTSLDATGPDASDPDIVDFDGCACRSSGSGGKAGVAMLALLALIRVPLRRRRARASLQG